MSWSDRSLASVVAEAYLEPGRGYWINLSDAGMNMKLPGSGMVAKPVVAELAASEYEGDGYLWAEDAYGHRIEIPLGVDLTRSREWPPHPPQDDLFDVCAVVDGTRYAAVPPLLPDQEQELHVRGAGVRIGLEAHREEGLWLLTLNGTPLRLSSETSVAVGPGDIVGVRVSAPGVAPKMASNYPNPFNPSTAIPFTLASGCRVRIAVYNALGQEVRELAHGYFDAGAHRVEWDGTDARGHHLANGVYMYRLVAGDADPVISKMVLLR